MYPTLPPAQTHANQKGLVPFDSEAPQCLLGLELEGSGDKNKTWLCLKRPAAQWRQR